MKKIFYVFIISQFCCSCVLGKKNNLNNLPREGLVDAGVNKIDNLKTTQDVIEFAKLINPDFAKEHFGELFIKPTNLIIKELKNCDLYEVWGIQNWQKIDLNNDSKTDLLFTAFWYGSYHQYAIMNLETGSYELFDLSSNIDFACKIIKPIVVDGKNELLVNNYKTDYESVSKLQLNHFTDTLTYKFNAFVEKNKKVADYDIEYIKFIFENNFEIEIDYSQNAHYTCLNAVNVSHLNEKFYKGESRKKIDKDVFNNISKLIEYINVLELPNEYSIDGYDFSTVWLEIKFKNGDIKKIRDYGFQGTYGINAVYDKMKKIALQTNWE